ncbi:peptide-methionine (S)-S-oxide reductase MsrA [Bizionia saleffrena]|uniref:Peptide methionine sulfoxide reductase MsrA n=1 Tax=Bizionia saleffrena TaxID=291189 RepID=A0A8H2QM73_9FLAO|nr:peptide-methionine (S)-S-oxide reductase MsrA [Bizionia saleffrena]TYB76767.1 peptide-methionine (S)-S-oxide reductase MsrA [Bizionia saleffrena]
MKENNLQRATFAGGCFWCTEAVFDRINGVESVISGYTGGAIKNPAYREICTGRTGHAEAIQIYFNPAIVSFTELMEVFFATHDPTTLNQQGHDKGTQYRSAIFYESEEQKHKADAFITFLGSEKVFKSKIVTEITALGAFYNAEDDHQEYYENNKEQSYCQFVINPKIDKLKTYYSDKLKEQ